MAVKKFNRKWLLEKDEEGYKIVPCKDENETEVVSKVLKANGRCARAGFCTNKDNKEIYFVVTKAKGAKKGDPIDTVEGVKQMNIV